MSKKVKYHIAEHSLTASCIKPLAICPLAKLIAPAVNLRVMCSNNPNGRFECTIFMHNKTECSKKDTKNKILDIMQQVCPQCQQHKPKQR